jgi:integrase
MASIQARHARACSTGKPWTTFEDATPKGGCSCKPTFYVTVRDGSKLHRERVGKDRQSAERALRKIGAKVDEGDYAPVRQMKFSVWAAQWLGSLKRETSTVRGYRSTVAFANRAFGARNVRSIRTEDVQAMLALMVADGLSPSTCAKHLRVLGACLQSAVIAGYGARNPVRLIPKGEKPRARRTESAYFQSDELPLVLAKVEHDVCRVLYLTALKTGMRLGELSALTWGDCDLLMGSVLRVRHSYTDGVVKAPKSHERRDVDVTPDVVEMLGRWFGEMGSPDDDTLVFPGATKSGYLAPDTARDVLYEAMEAAEIPRVGPTGEKRTFHSFRHTFAKIALENGRPLAWVSRHLGHSSMDVTDRHYGHFSRAARKREIEAMAGAFDFVGVK